MSTELAGPCGSDSSAGLGRAELDALPKPVLRELSAKALREYACEVRAERNKYLSLYVSTKTKADRLERELEDARAACRRMAEADRRARTFYRCCAKHDGMSFQMTVTAVVPAATVCPLCSAA